MPDHVVLSQWRCSCGTSGSDEVWLPLSYIAQNDGSYLLTCDARSKSCRIISITCTAGSATVTETAYTGTATNGKSWIISPLTVDTVVTISVTASCDYCGKNSASNTITVPASGTIPVCATYYTSNVTHVLTATVTNAENQQWQDSTDGSTWTTIEGATGTILIIGMWTGSEATTEEAAHAAVYAVIPA